MEQSFSQFWTDIFNQIEKGLVDNGPRLTLIVIVFLFFFLLAQLFKLYGQQPTDLDLYKKPDPKKVTAYNKSRQKIFRGRILWLIFTVLAWTFALALSGINVLAILGGLGFLGLGFAYAISNIIQQYVAGFLLLKQKHFNIGEQVTVKDTTGKIKAVEPRYTVVRDFMENDVMIPNTDILENAVVISEVQGKMRDFIRVRVASDTNMRKAIKVGEEALMNTEGVDNSVPARGYLRYFGSSYLLAFYYTGLASRREHFIVRNNVMLNLEDAFERAQIHISYPSGSHEKEED